MNTTDPLQPKTPAALGYRLPAEWEPHATTWLAWPHNRDDWPGRFGPIPWVYVDFVRQLSRFEPVSILIHSEKAQRRAADRLDRAGVDPGRVRFVPARTDRSWTRDSLPSFVVLDRARTETDALALVCWSFNGWAKYDDFHRDAKIGRALSRLLGIRRFVPRVRRDETWVPLVLEGGAIDTNGRGCLLTTEECLLSDVQTRNPGLTREQMEGALHDFLGINRVIWLGRGLVGDDTHGHVDDLARFVDPQTVVTVIERDPADPNHDPLRENLERLHASRDQDGRLLNVVTLPMPRPVVFAGQRLPASYANFLLANGAVFVPTFNDPADRAALATFETLFPDRTVIGIHALDLVWGLGAFHCMTREQPAPRIAQTPP